MDIDPALRMLIDELGSRMGLDGLALDDDGATSLRFDGRTIVNLQYRPSEEVLLLYTDLGAPAAGEALYGDLLRGNLFWRSTLGATLSLSGDEPPHVILASTVAWRGLDGPRLAARMETFIATAEDWGEVVAESPEAATGVEAPAVEDFATMIRA